MKVFGGTFDGMNRWIVAANSHTAAIKLWRQCSPNLSDYSARPYSGETGNEIEIAVATKDPGVVYTSPIGRYEYTKAKVYGEKNK